MSKVVRTAAQTAVLMAILTLGSKLIGFIREMVMANYFGTSYVVDAYVMAVAIPGIIFTGIFASVATAYMPLLSEKIEKEGTKAANRFTSHIINLLFLISIISALLGLFFSDQIVTIFASGFTGETAELTSFFIKVTFSYTLFSAASAILESFLQYKNTFLPQIIIGYSQSTFIIVAIVLGATFSYYFLPLGLLAAYVVRYILFMILTKRRGFEYSFSLKIKGTLRIIIPLAIPAFIGSSISQISIFVDKTLASGLVVGSVAALNYAALLNVMIMSLSISILTTIIYPKLAQANSLEDYGRFSDIVNKGVTLIVMVALPFSLGAMLYSGQIVQIVYERGAFDSSATALTGSAYLFYSAGLLFMALNDLLIRTFYSLHDMRMPMIFGGISVIIDIILNFILIHSMEHNGLALSTSIAAFCNTIFLITGLSKKYPTIKFMGSKNKFLKIIAASGISIGGSYIIYLFLILPFSHIIYMRMIQLGITVVIASVLYLALLRLFKIQEVAMLKDFIRR